MQSPLTLAGDPADGPGRLEALSQALEDETDQRRRAECMAHIQSDVMQRALDLLVSEPDISGFFRVFIQTLVEESESHACGVWLLDDDRSRCELWMANVQGQFFSKDTEDWTALALPRESMEAHLLADTRGLDERRSNTSATIRACRRRSATSMRRSASESVVVVPLVLPTRTLGWMALSAGPSQQPARPAGAAR